MWHTIIMLISNWPWMQKFSVSYYRQRQLLLTFLSMVTHWWCSTSNFYALIGQNLTGEFMQKIYAASWNLFTDSWSWQRFVSTCDVFNSLFPLDVQIWIHMLSRVICYSWFVYWVFGWEMHRLSKSSLHSKCFCLVSEQRKTGFGSTRNETRAKKWKRGEREGKEGNACRQTPGFWKPGFASQRSTWLAQLVEQYWHVSMKGLFDHTETGERSCMVCETHINFLWLLFTLVSKICPPSFETQSCSCD